MQPDARICVICKGARALCGLTQCPLLQRYFIQKRIKERLEKIVAKGTLFGPTPPNLFVGHFGYPRVRFGPLLSLGDFTPGMADDPSKWWGLPLEKIIEFRSWLFRPIQIINVHHPSRIAEKVQEMALSIAPVDIEAQIEQPKFILHFSSHVQPMGPYAKMEGLRICENPRIPRVVDSVLSEGLKAAESAHILYNKGFDVCYLTKALSAGLLGIKKKIVPTRWSITAVDGIISKGLLKKIREFPQLSTYELYTSEYMHNHFEILLIPGTWEFENFEAWAPGTVWSMGATKPEVIEDWEGFEGRKTYSIQGGGYYATRLAVAEALCRMRKQAKVIVFREVYEGYQLPLGVWQVRENVRNAFRKPPRTFGTLKEALEDIASKLRIPLREYIRLSKIIPQSRIIELI